MKDTGLGASVHVSQFGEGPRQVLALHCTLAQGGAWKGVARGLDRVVTMTAFDLPGHGRSVDWDGQGDYLDRTARLGAGLIGAPMDLVGHSFGAVAALRIALTHPDRVRSLTLIDTDTAGTMCFVEVGAFGVGSIVNTRTSGRVEKMDEKGYFKFGGSTVVVVFEPGKVQFSDDLITNSSKGLETLVKVGEPLARAL